MPRIAIVGKSGDGKTTSFFPSKELKIKGLNPKETVFINVAGKDIPMRGANKLYPRVPINQGGNYYESEDAGNIAAAIKYIQDNRKDVKNIVVDDAGYLMGLEIIAKAKTKAFDKWTDLAVNKMKMVNAIREMNRVRPEVNVFCVYHQEKADDNTFKIKTGGKMIDNNVLLDGLFTIILYTEVSKNAANGDVLYQFRTKANGMDTCKAPVGMFPEEYIPNDSGIVVDYMDKYYNEG